MKKILLRKISYYPEPDDRNKKKIELGLSNYTKKAQVAFIHQHLI